MLNLKKLVINLAEMNKSKDKTLEKNYVARLESLVKEYELIKQHNHPRYRFVKDFFKDNRIAHQNFSKYYHRYLESNKDPQALKPQKRGPKYKTRRIDLDLESKIVELRLLGLNKYDIQRIIKDDKKLHVPSLTTIYNYAKKHNLNIKNKRMKEEKVRYVRARAGELAHVDCHNLGRNIIKNDPKNYYLVSVVDDCTRIAWSEVVYDIKSLTVMFSVLRSLNMIDLQYGIKFQEMLTDNGPEFGSGKYTKNKDANPFERMLWEMGIKHRYTRPYRPQTNGKIERFWRTLNDDLIDETDFDTQEELKEELLQYMYYYNEARSHQGLKGKTPAEFFRSTKSASK